MQDGDGLDLASAIEQSLAVTDDPTTPVQPMTIQDINDTLDRVASSCAFTISVFFPKAAVTQLKIELGFMKLSNRASVWELSSASSSDSVSWLASCWYGMIESNRLCRFIRFEDT